MNKQDRISNIRKSKAFGMKSGDFIIIAATIMISLALLSRVFFFGSDASQADISANGEKIASIDLETGKLVYESPDISKVVDEFTVSADSGTTVIRIVSSGIHAVIECTDGRIRFAESDCPDRVCVNTGYISVNRQVAACVPAGLLISITGEASENDPDIIIG